MALKLNVTFQIFSIELSCCENNISSLILCTQHHKLHSISIKSSFWVLLEYWKIGKWTGPYTWLFKVDWSELYENFVKSEMRLLHNPYKQIIQQIPISSKKRFLVKEGGLKGVRMWKRKAWVYKSGNYWLTWLIENITILTKVVLSIPRRHLQ